MPTFIDTWHARGVAEFKAQLWLSAAICFSNGLKLEPQAHILRSNRSEVYIRLGWYNAALRDAQQVLESREILEDLQVLKATFRAARAHHHLGQYSNAADIADTLPNDKDCAEWSAKARQRLNEQRTGQYDWRALFTESQSNPSPHVADYVGPVEVKDVARTGGGRGVFLTQDVKAGTLLV